MSVYPQVQVVPVEALHPYERNARTHSPDQVAKLARSIREFGWTNPILVDRDGLVIAGHARLEAARSLGLAAVPTIALEHLTPSQVRAYIIADNQLALDAGWDEGLLNEELAALQLDGFDLTLTGFSDEDLDRLLNFDAPGTEGLTDEDETPEPGRPEDATSRPGDLWRLGAHRLVCGDSTSAAVVARLLEAHHPNLMVTDPPYGVEYDPTWRERAGVSVTSRGAVMNDDRADWREAWALFPGNVAYVWHAGLFASVVEESLLATGFHPRAQIVWAKSRFVLSRGAYHWQHEPCWYAVRKGENANWMGDRRQSTLWTVAPRGLLGETDEDASTEHGTQKPVEVMRRPILNHTLAGEAVYDPFSGSGSTIIAAEQTGRICLAVDLDPVYVDVAVRRWEKFTGRTAELVRG